MDNEAQVSSDGSGEWQSVDSGYEGDVRRIIVYRADPDDLVARRRAYERLADGSEG
ncbi:hypothetical protein [Kitasatospora sp. NPDC004272]